MTTASATDPARFAVARVPTTEGARDIVIATFGPFGANVTGIDWEQNDAGEERAHRLLCGVTHLATGHLVAQDLYDRGACYLAHTLARDAAMCAAFDTADPLSVAGRVRDAGRWDRLRDLIMVSSRMGEDD